MKLAQRWIIGISLAVAAGTPLAGEDSTERVYGSGPAFWDTCGVHCLPAVALEPGGPRAQP